MGSQGIGTGRTRVGIVVKSVRRESEDGSGCGLLGGRGLVRRGGGEGLLIILIIQQFLIEFLEVTGGNHTTTPTTTTSRCWPLEGIDQSDHCMWCGVRCHGT